LICFSPEFLREGDALKDNLYPSRIIIGSKENKAKAFANVLTNSAVSSKIQTLFMSSSEAEAIKLFSNSYLAMRVSFFNELDSFCLVNNMNTKNIIDGVCLDDRIGDGYNNPSFGYGGYCLPKDTKQLLTNFKHTPQNLIEAIVKSNDTRKNFIISIIEKMNIEVIGFYKLSMKKGSDNYRSAAVIDIIEKLKSMNKKIVIYEPEIFELEYSNCSIIRSIDDFKKIAQIVVANRISSEIEDIKDRVFTRDLFNRD
jgi:UDPglucose 6-dehydrogenase